ncbi:hypothetical protein C8F04DRAFT_1240227 [Mycena alexandri]|uniref:Uncharacterized protein n=1 Tax=Mycena alexandri TaxID=1745969 RepID=A0AAD6SAH8_9AGAR|nr:hypothetical protein C8F04DRAFT_1240227 [Mycena alexandri]
MACRRSASNQESAPSPNRGPKTWPNIYRHSLLDHDHLAAAARSTRAKTRRNRLKTLTEDQKLIASLSMGIVTAFRNPQPGSPPPKSPPTRAKIENDASDAFPIHSLPGEQVKTRILHEGTREVVEILPDLDSESIWMSPLALLHLRCLGNRLDIITVGSKGLVLNTVSKPFIAAGMPSIPHFRTPKLRTDEFRAISASVLANKGLVPAMQHTTREVPRMACFNLLERKLTHTTIASRHHSIHGVVFLLLPAAGYTYPGVWSRRTINNVLFI